MMLNLISTTTATTTTTNTTDDNDDDDARNEKAKAGQLQKQQDKTLGNLSIVHHHNLLLLFPLCLHLHNHPSPLSRPVPPVALFNPDFSPPSALRVPVCVLPQPCPTHPFLGTLIPKLPLIKTAMKPAHYYIHCRLSQWSVSSLFLMERVRGLKRENQRISHVWPRFLSHPSTVGDRKLLYLIDSDLV